MKKTLGNEHLEPLIFTLREHRVVLDADLARLYGVPTKALNQAVRRNSSRFPSDFAFQIAAAELKDLRSQFVTSSSQSHDLPKNKLNRSQFATGSHRLREQVAANTAILKRLAEIDNTLLQHDSALRDLYRKLLPLLQPPADPPKRRIGFHADKDQ